MSGSTITEMKDAYPVVQTPSEYQSPLEAIKIFYDFIKEQKLIEKAQKNQLNREEHDFLAAAAVLTRDRAQYENELRTRQTLAIQPGRSYAFDLESFCVDAGKHSPLSGDEFAVSILTGKDMDWLPKILENYNKFSIPQERVQILIWKLLTGARFDELSAQERGDLIKMDPNASAHFGNRALEKIAENVMSEIIPTEVLSLRDSYEEFRNILMQSQKSYEEIENILAPPSSRKEVAKMGWSKIPEGFFIRIKSLYGFSAVRLEVYMPPTGASLFRPSQILALPPDAQRLAISANAFGSFDQSYKKISNWLLDHLSQKLSEEEHSLLRKYPIDAAIVFKNAMVAKVKEFENFPTGGEDDAADAFRHFIWAGLNGKDLGTTRAREFLIAHEAISGQSASSKAMDLWNNERGLEASERLGKNASASDFEKAAFAALRDKKLKILKK
ncbi:MAG: hypothetical protein J0L93_01470 [Deltaproteobacteria bacterium]|nr:hypothetical protein [Deltaproteobacteria bacterium]